MTHPRTPAETLVALDVDGTLVSFDGRLSDAVRAAVADLRDAGAAVVLATGRGATGAAPVWRELGLDHGWAVTSNGAVTLRTDPGADRGFDIVDMVTFDPEPALRLLSGEMPQARFAVERAGVGFLVNREFPDGELGGVEQVVAWPELWAEPVTRVVMRGDDATTSPEEWHAMVERVGLHELTYAVGWSAWLDLTPGGVSKASALEALRRRLGVEPFATVAVGDGTNDLEMLRWAARGVAMGHAPEQVRLAADEVTGTIDDDGVVEVLRSLLG